MEVALGCALDLLGGDAARVPPPGQLVQVRGGRLADRPALMQGAFALEQGFIFSSMILAATIAQRTERMKIGTAVQVLPLCHPLRLAEEVATVDHRHFGVVRPRHVAAFALLP